MADTKKVDKPIYAWYGFGRWMTRWTFFSQLGGIEVIGQANVPKRGPVLIASTHLSDLDPPAIACATRRHLRFFAKEELFKGFFGKLITSLGAFPVRRGTGDTEAIRKTLDFLETNQAVLLFPEGTRGDGRRLGPLGRGAALLVKRSQALVVPAAINGTQRMLPKGQKKLRHGRIRVAFGKPFTYADVGNDREAFIARLEAEMINLSAAVGLPLQKSEATD